MARITVLELPATWGDAAAQIKRIDALIASDPATHLVLLPECSLTGYVSPEGDFDLAPFAETLSGATANAMRDLARRHRTTIVAPLVLDEGALSNAMIVVDPSGAIDTVYRKRHPWPPERLWATPGRSPHPVFRVGDLTMSIATCYDLHFLAREADTRETLERIDLLLFPSNWVDPEEESRFELLRDLARDYGCAIANANWAEGVVLLPGQGGSCILDGAGRPLAIAENGARRIDAVIRPRPG